MAPKVRGETCRDPAKVRAWLVPEAGTEVWARKSRLDQQWQEARLWWEADRKAGAAKLSLALRIARCPSPYPWRARGSAFMVLSLGMGSTPRPCSNNYLCSQTGHTA